MLEVVSGLMGSMSSVFSRFTAGGALPPAAGKSPGHGNTSVPSSPISGHCAKTSACRASLAGCHASSASRNATRSPVARATPAFRAVATPWLSWRTYSTPRPRYGSSRWRDAFAGSSFAPLQSGAAEHQHQLDREGFVAQIASWSYIAVLPEPRRSALLDRAGELAPEQSTVTFRTEFHWTRRA